MISKEDIQKLNIELKDYSPQKILKWGIDKFGVSRIALASSLGAEDQVLTEMILSVNRESRVFTLDTGRLPQETYDTIEETMKKYSMKYEILFPEKEDVEKMERELGPNLFYKSVENRKLCCNIRKVRPLKRMLSTLSCWVTGLRREQAVTREGVPLVEWDEQNQLVKLNPLAFWTESMVWDYIKSKNIPYNKLHDMGYPSIGCAPCTRPVKEGEDLRAGRWWWELPSQKECGLHVKDGKLVRGVAC